MNNMKRSFISFLFLVSLVFSATNTHIYDIDFPGTQTNEVYIETDLRIINEFVIEDSPGSVGANQYCEGAFTFDPSVTATWLVSSANYEAVAYYPPSYDASCSPLGDGDDAAICPAYPIAYNSVNTNRPVYWFSNSDYGNAWPGTAQGAINAYLSGHFYNQKINTYLYTSIFDEQNFNNKRGGVNLFCKGYYRIYVDGALASNQQITSLNDIDVDLDPGMHTISGRLHNVDCFGAVEKHPTNDGNYWITYMEGNSLNVGQQQVSFSNIQVLSSGDFDFDYLPGSLSVISFIDPPESPPFCYGPAMTSRVVSVIIENEGDIDGEITNVVGNTPGFVVTPVFDDFVFVDTDDPEVLEAGEQGTLWFILNYDGVSDVPDHVEITVYFEGDDPCGGGGGEVDFDLEIGIPTCLEDYYCVLEPSGNIEVEVGSFRSFVFLGCFNGDDPVPCDDWEWDVSIPADWTTEDGLVMFFPVKTVHVNSLGSGDLAINAEADGHEVYCSSKITATPPENSGPIVTNVTNDPTIPTNQTPIIINATGDDSSTGGDVIDNCEIEYDESGVWDPMLPEDGAYDEITEDIYFDVGLLPNGVHRFDLRCTDVEGYTGPEETHIITIGNGNNSGPIVENITHEPEIPTNLTTTNITAVGDDSGTGNDTIDNCQIQVDDQVGGAVWSDMEPLDGSYDEVTEEIYFDLGILTSGEHTVRLRCIDSEGYIGPSEDYTFVITEDYACTVTPATLSEEAFGVYRYDLNCFYGGAEVDCGDVESELSSSGLEWDFSINPSVNHEVEEVDYSLLLTIDDYFDQQEGLDEIEIDVEATIPSGEEDFDDLVCDLDTQLPNLLCEIFI